MVVIAPIDETFLALSPEEFIKHVLVHQFAPVHIVEGSNFFFGLCRSGSVATLRQAGQFEGWTVDQLDPVTVEIDGVPQRISSTLIDRERVHLLAEELDENPRAVDEHDLFLYAEHDDEGVVEPIFLSEDEARPLVRERAVMEARVEREEENENAGEERARKNEDPFDVSGKAEKTEAKAEEDGDGGSHLERGGD